MAILADSFYCQELRIDTINTRVFADLIAKEGDANGRGLLVTLTENGLMKDTTGIALNLKWEHTSVGNQGLDNFEAVDLSKGLYKITYPTEMLNRGKVRAFIQIIDSGKLTGTRNIEIAVDRGVGDDTAIASSDSFTALAQALIDVNNLESTYAPELLSIKQQLAAKAEQTALNIEKARIDSFTTLAAGSTTGDAELIDGRIGADGITYPNIGGAVRSQIATLDSRTKFDAENSIINGDFSNGSTDWLFVRVGNPAMADGSITFNPTAAGTTSSIAQDTNFVSGHVYYLQLNVNLSASARLAILEYDASSYLNSVLIYNDLNHPAGETTVSLIYTCQKNDARLVITNYMAAITDIATIGYIAALDLTLAFASMEMPNKSEIERLLARYPNSWFDGKKPLETTRTLYEEKIALESRMDGAEITIGDVTATLTESDIATEITGTLTTGAYPYAASVGSTVKTMSSTYRRSLKHAVNAGDRCRIYCSVYKNAYGVGYIVADKDNKALAIYYDTDLTGWVFGKTIEVTMPENAAFLYVNSNSTNSVTYIPKAWSLRLGHISASYTKEEIDTAIDTSLSTGRLYKPQILFNFDDPGLIYTDGRHELMKKYRIPYTVNVTVSGADAVTYPGTPIGANHTDALIEDGVDFAVYSSYLKPAEDATIYNSTDSAVVTQFETYVQTARDAAAAIGVFNPTAWFSRFNRTGTAMNQALINCGFKICRGYKYGTNESTYKDFAISTFNNSDKNNFNVESIGLYPSSYDDVITAIDNAITNGRDISPFTHKIYATNDEADTGNGITYALLDSFLAYIRGKIDAGECEAATYREYYKLKYPADGMLNDFGRIMKYEAFKRALNQTEKVMK